VAIVWKYQHYLGRSHHLIAPEGTTPEQFTKLCDDLIEPAVDELIRRNGRAIYPPDEELDDFKTWIGWDGIVETIAKKLLPQHGYQIVRFHEVTMWGGGIIGGSFNPVPYEEAYSEEHAPNEHSMSKTAYDKVKDFNQLVRKQQDNWYKGDETTSH
jgi:hypothetical protein